MGIMDSIPVLKGSIWRSSRWLIPFLIATLTLFNCDDSEPPDSEIVKLLAPDAQAGDGFGYSVALSPAEGGVSGDYAIVGADGEDAGGIGAGAAYVFRRTGANSWDGGTRIVAPDAQAYAFFGTSVALSGDYAIVGAPWAWEYTGGILAGAAYIFKRTGANSWDGGTKIAAPDAQAEDYFGRSVALSGDYAIVGADGEDAGGMFAGAAYVFRRTGTNSWDGGTKIMAPDAEGYDGFGWSVALSGDYSLVGAPYEDTGDIAGGAAYVFK
ncbi:MAG: FG-GAP repeat protein [Candidatus Neomarinimicrobiota bacterium]